MKITENHRIIEIQSEFNEKFPYLKIEFYKEPHKSGEGSEQDLLIDPYQKVGHLSHKDTSQEELSIHGNLKVETLESNLRSQFGLFAQVFRKSRGHWLQTTATDSWTLADQNEAGSRESQ